VTGINGFAGAHLASVLLGEGHEVQGVSERPEHRGTLPPAVPLFLADVRDRKSVEPYLCEYKPDVIFHLAGFASPSRSRQKTAECLSVNVLGTAGVLEAVASKTPDATVVVITTAHFHEPLGGIVDEDSPLDARDPYTISKICAHHLCRLYHDTRDVRIIEGRPANHFGPGQQPGFVVADFAKQVAEISSGRKPPRVRVGNLDVARDFLYVRDVARAYVSLAEKGTPGEAYCIGSGQPVKVRDILSELIGMAGRDIEIETDADKVRPGELSLVAVSSAKLTRDTGWQPATTFREGLALTLDYWRSHLEGAD
jgi:GDP-4-dehydro-6-deoxy-D-mannose reductase